MKQILTSLVAIALGLSVITLQGKTESKSDNWLDKLSPEEIHHQCCRSDHRPECKNRHHALC